MRVKIAAALTYAGFAGLMILGGVAIPLVIVKSVNGPKETTEFVCYDDGKLVERHVGVARATPLDAGVWVIRYTDDSLVRYLQPAGETCGVEAY